MGERSRLRVAFSDFWPTFDPSTWFVTRVLGSVVDVEIAEPDAPADVLFFGSFGKRHLGFRGLKIYCSAEVVPDPRGFDYSIDWQVRDSDHHLRLPFFWWTLLDDPHDLGAISGVDETQWRARPNFCSFVYSNWRPRERREFFEVLHRRRPVTAAGDVLNNAPRLAVSAADPDWRAAKIDYLRSFRFVIAFENQSVPGYTTEKPMDALVAGAIPIYWGNPDVGNDIDVSRMILASTFADHESLADHVCALDDGLLDAAPVLERPALSGDAVDRITSRLADFLERVVDDAGQRRSRSLRGTLGAAELGARRARDLGRVRLGLAARQILGTSASTYFAARPAPVGGDPEGPTTGGRPPSPHEVDLDAGLDIEVRSAALLGRRRDAIAERLVYVAGADERYFDALLTQIAAVHRLDGRPHPEIQVLDLGFRERQASILQRLDGVVVRRLPDELVRELPHLAEVRTWAWKVWLVRATLAAGAPILYLDAGACLVRDPSPVVDVLAEHDVLLVDDPSQNNRRWTHAEAVRRMGATDEELAGNQLWAGIFGFVPSVRASQLLEEVWRFARDPACIGGDLASHRRDQSIFSIVSHRLQLPRQRLEQFGEWRGQLHDDQVILVHRLTHVDHRGLRWRSRSPLQAAVDRIGSLLD